jgi:hypothetical protein
MRTTCLAARPAPPAPQTTGQKLLDVFTVHYYPQGGEYGGGTDSAMQLAGTGPRGRCGIRLHDETWIGDKVRLIRGFASG